MKNFFLSLIVLIAAVIFPSLNAAADDSGPSGSEGLDYVLSQLDPAYANALEELRGGDPIANGTQRETVRTVQTMFNEFGFNLPLTGGFYNQSMGALQTLEATFGAKKTDLLDADTLERLMAYLLYYRAAVNETSEGKEFPNTPGFAELERNMVQEIASNDHQYLIGCAYEMAGSYWEAYQAFKNADTDDAQTRMDSCEQSWPANGEIYRDPSFYGTNAVLHIKIGKSDSLGVMVKIFRSGENVSSLFLGKGDTVTAYLAGGSKYQIKLGAGEKWFGVKDAFGDIGNYEVMTYEDGSDKIQLDAGYIYTLNINTTTPVPGDPVDSDDIPYETF